MEPANKPVLGSTENTENVTQADSQPEAQPQTPAEEIKQDKPKGELLCFGGGLKSGGL